MAANIARTLAIVNQLVTDSQLTVLPCKHVGERIERSYPGAPDMAGWTVFTHTARDYVHKGDPLFANEPEAKAYLHSQYNHQVSLSRNDSLAFSES